MLSTKPCCQTKVSEINQELKKVKALVIQNPTCTRGPGHSRRFRLCPVLLISHGTVSLFIYRIILHENIFPPKQLYAFKVTSNQKYTKEMMLERAFSSFHMAHGYKTMLEKACVPIQWRWFKDVAYVSWNCWLQKISTTLPCSRMHLEKMKLHLQYQPALLHDNRQYIPSQLHELKGGL